MFGSPITDRGLSKGFLKKDVAYGDKQRPL